MPENEKTPLTRQTEQESQPEQHYEGGIIDSSPAGAFHPTTSGPINATNITGTFPVNSFYNEAGNKNGSASSNPSPSKPVQPRTQEAEIPASVNQSLNETAQEGARQASDAFEHRQQAVIQNRWEPTAANIKASGLNYADYVREARKAGATVNQMDVLNAFYGQDPAKSIEENEKERKRAESREKMSLLGNAITHLGNFIGAAAGGGHAAVPLESPVTFTERQRALKDKTDALRTKAWQDTYTMLKSQQAEERAARTAALEERKLEENRAHNEALMALALRKQQSAEGMGSRKFDHQVSEDEKKDKRADEQLKINQQNANAHTTSASRAGSRSGGSRGGSGGKDYTSTTVSTYDENGNRTGSTTTRTYGTGGKGGSKSGGGKPKAPWKRQK